MWIQCFIPLYSPLNLYLIILWILDFKYILLLLIYDLMLLYGAVCNVGSLPSLPSLPYVSIILCGPPIVVCIDLCSRIIYNKELSKQCTN